MLIWTSASCAGVIVLPPPFGSLPKPRGEGAPGRDGTWWQPARPINAPAASTFPIRGVRRNPVMAPDPSWVIPSGPTDLTGPRRQRPIPRGRQRRTPGRRRRTRWRRHFSEPSARSEVPQLAPVDHSLRFEAGHAVGDSRADDDPLGGDGERPLGQLGEEHGPPRLIEAGFRGCPLDHDWEERGGERGGDGGQLVASPEVELGRAVDEVVVVEDHAGGQPVGHLGPCVGVDGLAQRPLVKFLGIAEEMLLEILLALGPVPSPAAQAMAVAAGARAGRGTAVGGESKGPAGSIPRRRPRQGRGRQRGRGRRGLLGRRRGHPVPAIIRPANNRCRRCHEAFRYPPFGGP